MKGCTVCGKDLHPRNVTGFCRRCHGEVRNRDPEYRAKVVAGEKRRLQLDPEARARKRAVMIANRNVPGAEEKRKAAIAASRTYALAAANAVNVAGSAGRVLAGKKRTATMLAWCPPHLRDEYRHLWRVKRIPAAEARQMIESQNELEMARWRRSIGAAEAPKAIKIDHLALIRDPVERLMTHAASLFGLEVADITCKARIREFMPVRYAVAISLKRAGMSFVQIAKAMSRDDHTTARHLFLQGEEQCRRNPEFARKIDELVAVYRRRPALKVAA